ncbi:MAG: sigma-70 family RNA polymerase sigma factor [Moorea sp. SIO3H5]|nr:sigma-70 family RNA polymerase sigma factor [Moorena sp. SIO3H5]
MSDIQLEATSTALGQSHHVSEKQFWQQWQQYQDYLYHRCLRWMGGNPTDAEDALSRAMLKAWEKVQKFAGKIANFKAWLTKLTHNLCVDIHREHGRSANQVEDIEGIPEEKGLVSCDDTPERVLETDEKKIAIRRAIDNLPPRLHQTFILHFYQELSYREIAQQQNISYQNVCKRISQARAILREELRGYFIGEDETDQDLSVTPINQATESTIREMSQPNGEVKPIVGETVTSSVAVEELDSGVGEEVQEVALLVQHSESVPVAATSEEKLEVNNEALLRGGMKISGVGILPARKLKQARCLFHSQMPVPQPDAHPTKLSKSSRIYSNYTTCEVQISGLKGAGSREQRCSAVLGVSPMSDCIKTGAGKREERRGKREEGKNNVYLMSPRNPIYNAIASLSFLITICSNFHPVKLTGIFVTPSDLGNG